MTHHLLPEVDRAALAPFRHALPDPGPARAARLLRQGPGRAHPGRPRPARSRWRSSRRSAARWSTPRDLLDRARGRPCARSAQALGVPFDDRMLAWPAGPRDSDGVWAPHWYDSVWASTGFAPVPPRRPRRCPPASSRSRTGACPTTTALCALPASAPAGGPDAADVRRAQPRPDRQRRRQARRTATRPGSARSTRSCRAATRSGRGCGCTTAGSSGWTSTWPGCARSARALAFTADPLRRGDHRARSGARWPPTACATACTSGSR